MTTDASDLPPREYTVVVSGVPFAYGKTYFSLDVGEMCYKRHRAYLKSSEEAFSHYTGLEMEGVAPLADDFEQMLGSDGEVLDETNFIWDGERLPNYVNDAGMYVVSGVHSGRVAQFPFVFSSRHGWLFKPAVYRVVKSFGACVPSESLLRSVTLDICRAYPTLPVRFIQNLTGAFKDIAMALNKVPQGVPIHSTVGLVPSFCFDKSVILGACMQLGLWELEYVRSDIRPSVEVMERRDILDVMREHGGRLVDGQLEWNTPCTKALKKVLVATQLCGVGRFAYAAANSANQAAALTRVFKPRGGSLYEDLLATRRQLTFVFDTYACDSIEFLRMGRARIDPGPFKGVTFISKHPHRRWERLDHPRHPAIRAWASRLLAEYLTTATFLGLLSWLGAVLGFSSASSVGTWIYEQVRDFSSVVCAYGKRLGLFGVSAAGLACCWIADYVTFRYFTGHLPHAKGVLRKHIARARYGEVQPIKHDCFVGRITAEVKDEGMKSGKPPRLYFSLGLISALFGGGYIDAVKKHLYRTVVVVLQGWELEVQFLAENSPSYVGQAFRHAHDVMTSGMQQMFALYMSDDVLVVTPDGAYDLDISMCDASIGLGVFWLVWLFLRACLVPEAIIRGLLGQLSKDVVITNPSNKQESVVWRFITYYLVSGTVLTTLTDSIASLLVISAFAAGYSSGVREPGEFVEWFEAIGLVVTVERHEQFSRATMLKRHPMRLEDGTWCAPLAFGCLLKRFGLLDCDLTRVPGITLQDKAEHFLGGVVESWKGEPGHPLLDTLRERFPFKGYRITDDERLDKRASSARLSVDSFCDTYNIDRSVYDEAVGIASEMTIGSVACCELMTRVNSVDYGL